MGIILDVAYGTSIIGFLAACIIYNWRHPPPDRYDGV